MENYNDLGIGINLLEWHSRNDQTEICICICICNCLELGYKEIFVFAVREPITRRTDCDSESTCLTKPCNENICETSVAKSNLIQRRTILLNSC